MAKIDLSKYGITGATDIVYNPSYELLFEEETKAGLEGYEVGKETELGAVNVCLLYTSIPMTLPGIISGVTMVFLPAMTNYVVLDMIYNSTYIMGSLIGSYFNAYDWHNGSMISILLLILMFFVTWITDRFAKKQEVEARGGGIW